MNTHTLDLTTQDGGRLIFNFNFKQDRELLTEYTRQATDHYIMNITLESCFGGSVVYDLEFSGHATIGINATSVNYQDATIIPVYGAYFNDEVTPTSAVNISNAFGVDPNTKSYCGITTPPLQRYDFQYPNYYNNEYVWEINGQTVSGQFNQTQGWASLWTIIGEILNQLCRFPGFSGSATFDFIIDTNIPFFDTYEHMHAYAMTGATDGLLNGYIAPPVEDEARYYIDNLVSNNGNISDIREENYYHFDGADNCLGFASEDGIHATLYTFSGGPSAVRRSDDRGITYETVDSYPTSYYVRADLSVPAYVITFNTNIPFFVGDENDTGKQKLDSYISGNPAPSGRTYTIGDAWNRSDIDGTINGVIGELVENTVNGTSSIVYGDGVQMFSLTATQKGAFLREILSGDVMDALSDATKMFGASAISALQSLRYMPIDASEVCTLSTAASCQIGSYTHTFSSSVDRIIRNDKMINCGSAFFKSPYDEGDFRNLEPWCKLYILLPYAGCHPLAISKYINKNITIKLAVDITSGACEYHIYAGNVEMDSFTGYMGSQIPLTAEDNAQKVAGIQNGLIQVVSGLAQIGITAGAAGASGGTLTPLAVAGGVSGANTMAQGLQNMSNSFNNAPVDTKGASVGNLGDFGVNSPYFIFCWANSLTPKNELNVVGKPSNTGGKVSGFAGFLQCSAFNLANGFSGTETEANEIYNIMSSGVYC